MTRSVVDEAPFEGRKNELLAIAWMAFSIFVVMSLYSSATGIVGATLSSWLKRALGDSAVVPALFLFGYGVLILRKKRWSDLYRRLTAVTLMYGAGLTAYHLLVVESTSPVTPYWARKIGEDGGGSGWLGGVISAFLLNAIGIFGAVVLLLACFFAGVVLISDRSHTGAPWMGRIGNVLARSGRGVLNFAAGIKGEAVQLGQAIAAGKARRQQRRAEKTATSSGSPGRRPGLRQRRAARRARRERRHATQQVAASMAAPIYDQDNDAFHRHDAAGFAYETAYADASSDDDETDTFAPVADLDNDETADMNGHLVPNSVEPAPQTDEWSPPPAPFSEEGFNRRREPAPREEAAAKARPATGGQTSGDTVSKPPEEMGSDYANYQLPSPSLLERSKTNKRQQAANEDQSQLLVDTLATFGVETKIVAVNRGPVVTRYELQPAPGVKVSRIVNLADDVSLNLAAAGVRIEAPVPGKSVVGIEVPNKHTSTVSFRDLVESPEFTGHPSKIAAALGKDITGNPVIADMTKVLHLLIAGATGSGKSVCINTLICSILYKARPDEVKLLMIDPKRVELAVYDGIPHLITPVVTDPKLAANALRWAVKEMEDRYKAFSEHGVRNIAGYNQEIESGTIEAEPMPYIAVIIDELADLMLVAGNEVEDAICRLAQMARAAGIHLVIATQRPSVDVITGLIKANVPSRLSFAVSSGVDSRTILDMMGAERLIGKGDMLYYPIGMAKPVRAQGAFISDREVRAIVNACKKQAEPDFVENVAEPERQTVTIDQNDDELYDDAVRLVVEAGSASISMIQRRFRVGYARAARLIDMMELAGVVGPYQGSKPRDVLKSVDDVFDDESLEQEAAQGESDDPSPDEHSGDGLSEAVNN